MSRMLHEHGIALVMALLLLLTVTVLGMSGLLTAGLELQMAGNVQYEAEAFQAADFGIEQALHLAALSTGYTLASPAIIPASGTLPVPGSTSATYTYRLYYDTSAGITPVPGGSPPGATNLAFHFVIESTGASARGASVQLTQSFYVLAPSLCANAGAGCDFSTGARRRTAWSQAGLE